MYIEGDVPYVTGNGYNNNNGFGNGWEGLIGLALVASLFGGWGFGGFGGRGGSYGGNCATQADLSAGFANSEIMSDLNDILLGQASMQNFINQGFNGIQNTLTTSFANLNTNLCSLGYNQAQLVNGLSRELADCCCKTNLAIQDLKYSNERQTCDLITNQNNNTRAILDFLTNEKIEGLRAENTALKGQISNDMQTRNIISGLRDTTCPIPAYVVPNPNCCYNPLFSNYNSGCCSGSIQ